MLVNDLLNLRTLDEAGFRLDLEEVDLRELLGEQAAAFEGQLAGRELRLELPDAPLYVEADRRRVGQVVGNLLSNAIKYSPEGGEIKITVRREGSDAVIAVSDQGVGIAPKDTERIFEKFFRTEEAARTVGGTGLGLAVAREIVTSHGGTLDVESEPGEGSTFSVTMPLQARRAAVGGGSLNAAADS